jgi:hypothetical protein
MMSPDHGLRLSAERQQSDVNRSDTRRHTLQKAPPQTVHDIENRRPDSRIGLSRERRRHDRRIHPVTRPPVSSRASGTRSTSRLPWHATVPTLGRRLSGRWLSRNCGS